MSNWLFTTVPGLLFVLCLGLLGLGICRRDVREAKQHTSKEAQEQIIIAQLMTWVVGVLISLTLFLLAMKAWPQRSGLEIAAALLLVGGAGCFGWLGWRLHLRRRKGSALLQRRRNGLVEAEYLYYLLAVIVAAASLVTLVS